MFNIADDTYLLNQSINQSIFVLLPAKSTADTAATEVIKTKNVITFVPDESWNG